MRGVEMASRKIQTYQNKANTLCTISFLFDLDGECKFVTKSSPIAEGPRDASCQLKLANCHATVQKLLVRQVLNQISPVAN